MKRYARVWIVTGALGLAASGTYEAEEDYVLDRYEVKTATVAPESPILIGSFSTEKTDFGTLKKETQQETADMMKRAAPAAFMESLRSRLDESGAFGTVAVYAGGDVPTGSLLIEGEFTELNPGNRAKRYWAMGAAGKSRVCFKGRVLDAARAEVVTFEECRTGSGLWTMGGNSAGMGARHARGRRGWCRIAVSPPLPFLRTA